METLVKSQASEDMIRELKSESPTLTELNDKFRHVAKNIDILTCYELSPTKTAIEVFLDHTGHLISTNSDQMPDGSWQREGPPMMMVSLDSARQWYPREELVACNADHSQIAKLKRGENSIYPSVRWAIKKALLSAGDLYSEAKGIQYDEPHSSRIADEESAARRSLLQVTQFQVSMPSNDHSAHTVPIASRSPSEDAIDKQIRHLPQLNVDQSAHHDNTQSKSIPFTETVSQRRSGLEVSEWDDRRSSANPIKSLDTDTTSALSDEDVAASKNTELTTSLDADFTAPKASKEEINLDLASKEIDKYAASQTEDSTISPTGSRSMIMDKLLESTIIVGDETKTKELLAYRYDVNCKDNDGITPLLLAARYKHENIIRLLLDQGAHPGAICNKGKTTLHWVTWHPETPITETLMDLLLRERPPLEVADGVCKTPLMLACSAGELLLATRLIHHGAKICAPNSNGWTVLHYAAWHGRAQMIPLLISNGAELEAKDPSGQTPLHVAVGNKFDHCATVEQLLRAGADKEAIAERVYRRTPLHSAVLNRHSASVKCLLESGANVEASDSDGWRPLHLAARQCQLAIVKALLDHRANPDNADRNGWTSLHHAAYYGHLEKIKALLDHGANPTIKTRKFVGAKPSNMVMKDAVSSTQEQAIRVLLKEAEKTWKQSSKK